MTPLRRDDDGLKRFRQFLAGRGTDRVFEWPTGHPSHPTGFCPCDWPLLPRLQAYAKALLALAVLRCPVTALKAALLRRLGAQIGRNTYISVDVWIDPLFPQLLTIEDNVMVGQAVKIALHEFGRDRFRAGRSVIRQGAVIGGFALLAPGVEIGENAVVGGGAVVGRDVPAGMLAVGNPARIFPQMPLEQRRQT
jgi:acetyltransferase-like isoleucine patch superfamily enzyme